MMTAVDRLREAERIRGYLVSTGDFGNLAARGLVNDAANGIAVSAERSADRFPAAGRDLDGRQALEYMRDTLGELANHEPNKTRAGSRRA